MSRHPRDMTMAELEALPTVKRIFRIERSFVAANGAVWDVGRGAPAPHENAAGRFHLIWVKAVNREPPDVAARAEKSRET